MEQNRILGIVCAVGAFLIVVVGAALILYSPANNPSASMTTIQNLDSTWVSQQPLKLEPLQTQPQTDLASLPVVDPLKPNPGTTPLSQTTQQASAGFPTSVQSLNVYSDQTTVISGQTTAINLNDITKVTGDGSAQKPVSTNQTTQTAAGVQTGVVKTTQAVPQQTQPKAAVPVPAKTTAAPSKTAATKTSAKTTPAQQTITDKYWIQAASYTSKKNAEELRSELSAEKINCEIFTFTDVKGVLYYRVRVGPYSTKSEAEYWQTRVTLVDRLAGAETYITNSSAPKN